MLTTIADRDQTNDCWPHEHQGIRGWRVINRRIASDVLKDIETVSLDDVCCVNESALVSVLW